MSRVDVRAKYLPDLYAIALTVRFQYVRAVQTKPDFMSKTPEPFSVTDLYFQQEHINVTVSYMFTMELLDSSSDKRALVMYALMNMYYKAHPADEDIDKVLFDELVSRTENVLYCMGVDIRKNDDKEYHTGGLVAGSGKKFGPTGEFGVPQQSPVQSLKDACAGLDEVVYFPKGTQYEGRQGVLYQVIQILNDTDKWTREQIADWLESLDVDITVTTKE